MKITIIGSVNGQDCYTPEQVAACLPQDLAEFTVHSRFYSGVNDTIKLYNDPKSNCKNSNDWAVHALEQERRLGVHHPHKSWFVVESESGQRLAGNICPRLSTLEMVFAESIACENSNKISYLSQLYRHCLRVASQFGKRLDAGLANFGIDRQGNVFYLADDIHPWDGFQAFCQSLGNLVLDQAWLDRQCAAKLAKILREQVVEFFPNMAADTIIVNQLREILMEEGSEQEVFDKIIKNFQANKSNSKTVHFTDRYWAIIADIHANLPALDAVLAFLKRENISQGIVLGDTVGYGPYPVECIERLQESGFAVIKGNHDHAAATGNIRQFMSKVASWCIDWTIPRLTDAHCQWLDALPLELTGTSDSARTWLAVHGAPIDPNYFYGYVYEMTFEDNLDTLEERQINWCFHGHSHIQGVFARQCKGIDNFYHGSQQDLSQYQHCLICPGSVGQPRDGACGAQLAIVDQIDQKISFLTLPYPLEQTIAALRVNAFPELLAERLAKGF